MFSFLQWCHGIARGSNLPSAAGLLIVTRYLQWCHGIARGSNQLKEGRMKSRLAGLQWCHGIARGSNLLAVLIVSPSSSSLQWCHGIARGSNQPVNTIHQSLPFPSMVPRDRPWIKHEAPAMERPLCEPSMVPRDRPWIKPLNSSKVENVEHRLLQWCHGIARGSNGGRRCSLVCLLQSLQWCHGIARGSNP